MTARRRWVRTAGTVAAAVVVAVAAVYFLSRPELPGGSTAGEQVNAAELDRLGAAPLPAAAPASAAGWPQWLGPARDGRAPPGPLADDWTASPPTVLWSAACGGGYSSLAVSGGRVYTQDRRDAVERVLCLDAATGAELGAFAVPADYSALKAGYTAGPRATPAVDADRVYALGAAGHLVCLQPEAPGGPATQPRWQLSLPAEMPQWGFSSSPLIGADLVVVLAGGKAGSVLAFDKLTGERRWAAGADPAGYSSPVAATCAGVRQIIAVTGNSVLGVRPADGTILWRHPWETQFNGNIATPVVAGDYVFVSAGYNKGCSLLHLLPAADGVRAEPVYFRRNRVMRNHHSTSVLRDGFVFGYDDDLLRCVDLRRGEAVPDWEGRDAGNKALAKGCVILAGNKLVGLTHTGTVFLADADPAEFRFRGKVEGVLSGSECWALPVLVDGRLFVRGPDKVVCLDARPAGLRGRP